MGKIAILLIVSMVIGIVFLSGCTDNPFVSEKNKLVGTWEEQLTSSTTLVFFSDGTCVSNSHEGASTSSGEWELKDNKLVMTITFGEETTTSFWDYSFSNDDNILYLTSVGSDTVFVFDRQ